MRRGGMIDGPSVLADAKTRRDLLDELRRNGVEHELRDGREFTVLKRPSFVSDEHALAPRIAPRRARGFAIA